MKHMMRFWKQLPGIKRRYEHDSVDVSGWTAADFGEYEQRAVWGISGVKCGWEEAEDVRP